MGGRGGVHNGTRAEGIGKPWLLAQAAANSSNFSSSAAAAVVLRVAAERCVAADVVRRVGQGDGHEGSLGAAGNASGTKIRNRRKKRGARK